MVYLESCFYPKLHSTMEQLESAYKFVCAHGHVVNDILDVLQ